MGSFLGHILPGSFFVIFALWWTVQAYCRYYKSLRKGSPPFHCSPTFPGPCLCGRDRTWEMEGYLKLFFATLGFTLEIITAYVDGKFVHLGNGQHATMFFMFGLSGVLDIMVAHQVTLPKGMQYAGLVLALSVEGLLFKFHLHGRTDLDVLIHTLLLYAIGGSIWAVFMEMYCPASVLASLTRAYFTLVQGTWFWQLAFILYNPLPGAVKWKGDDHGQMMVATMMFAWHLGGVFIFMLIIGGVVRCVDRRRYPPLGDDRDRLNMRPMKAPSNGHTLLVNNESDEEEEFGQTVPSA